MPTVPQAIQDDVAAIVTAVGKLQDDQAALPALKAAAESAIGAFNTGQAAVNADIAAVDTATQKLVDDIKAIESPPAAPAS